MLHMIWIIWIVLNVDGTMLISRNIEYKTMAKAPDYLSFIETHPSVINIEMCINICWNNEGCMSLIFGDGDSTCHLHNTSDGSVKLLSRKEVVPVITKKVIYGNPKIRLSILLAVYHSAYINICMCVRVGVCWVQIKRQQAQSINISKHPSRLTSINLNTNTTTHTLI